MAEALVRHHLARSAVEASVSSCGELRGSAPADSGAVRAMAKRGIDLASHRSAQISAQRLANADLVLAMTRRHLREVVLVSPDVFPRAFTMKELVRRANDVGARRSNEPLDAWLAVVHEGRTRAALLGIQPEDDIDDPMGGHDEGFDRTAEELDRLVRRLVELAFEPRASDASQRSSFRRSRACP